MLKTELSSLIILLMVHGIVSSPVQAQENKELSDSDIVLIKKISVIT